MALSIDMFYQPELEQIKTMSQVFENPYSSRDQNIHFSGATYKCIKADKYSIYATKVINALQTGDRIYYYVQSLHTCIACLVNFCVLCCL